MNVRRCRRLVADRVDDDDRRAGLRRLSDEDRVLMRGRMRRIGAPDHDRARVLGGARVEAHERGAERKVERHMAGFVADRVRVHFGRAHAIEEAKRKRDADQADGAGVVRMQDLMGVAHVDHAPELSGNFGQGLVPGNLDEAVAAFRADPP